MGFLVHPTIPILLFNSNCLIEIVCFLFAVYFLWLPIFMTVDCVVSYILSTGFLFDGKDLILLIKLRN